jgi:ubiquinol-cytochrome c reductase cytochrome c subunit
VASWPARGGLVALGLGLVGLGILLLGTLPRGAAAPSSSPAAGASQAALIRTGSMLYDQHCTSCHGIGGLGTNQGPPLLGVGAAAVDFYLSTGRMPLADATMQPVRERPAFTPPEIDALVAYITSLYPGGPPIPPANPAAGDEAYGGVLFRRNCAPCHSSAASGDAVGGGAVAPALTQATATQIEEAARVGPGVMPRFDEHALSQHDLDSIARYVISMRVDKNPGGLDLQHVGPVLEGLVGWIVGLGVILVAIRWIGTTV